MFSIPAPNCVTLMYELKYGVIENIFEKYCNGNGIAYEGNTYPEIRNNGYVEKAIIISATNFRLKNDDMNIDKNIVDNIISDVMIIKVNTFPAKFILKTKNAVLKKNSA